MRRVLIVDDDFIVRTYLKQMIDWKSEGFALLGDAKNGKEALDICLKEKPDIVITDMSMPIMDGMGLIKALKEHNISANILVLSCHDDFAYVKEAMQLGIDDYLLKNDLTPESLLNVLHKIKPKQIIADDTNDEQVSTEELIAMGKRKLQTDFFRSFGNVQLKDDKALQELANKANINSKFAMANACLIEIDQWKQRLDILEHEDLVNFYQAFKEMCQNICNNHEGMNIKVNVYIFQTEMYSKYWSILFDFVDTNSLANINKYLQIVADKINTFSMRYFNLQTRCYLTSTQKSLASLKQHYHNLFALLPCKFYVDSKIISEENMIELTALVQESTHMLITNLAKALIKDEAVFTETWKIFIEELSQKQYNLSCLKQIAIELAVELNTKFKLNWEEITDFAKFIAKLNQRLLALREELQAKDIEHPAIRNALNWIDEHYREPISQQIVADFVHLNPAYFSTLFKKSMGTTFSDYLINYRLDKVKNRLTTDSNKIKTIAQEEGFADYQYFCKVFKRIIGVSPSEYRSETK